MFYSLFLFLICSSVSSPIGSSFHFLPICSTTPSSTCSCFFLGSHHSCSLCYPSQDFPQVPTPSLTCSCFSLGSHHSCSLCYPSHGFSQVPPILHPPVPASPLVLITAALSAILLMASPRFPQSFTHLFLLLPWFSS